MTWALDSCIANDYNTCQFVSTPVWLHLWITLYDIYRLISIQNYTVYLFTSRHSAWRLYISRKNTDLVTRELICEVDSCPSSRVTRFEQSRCSRERGEKSKVGQNIAWIETVIRDDMSKLHLIAFIINIEIWFPIIPGTLMIRNKNKNSRTACTHSPWIQSQI